MIGRDDDDGIVVNALFLEPGDDVPDVAVGSLGAFESQRPILARQRRVGIPERQRHPRRIDRPLGVAFPHAMGLQQGKVSIEGLTRFALAPIPTLIGNVLIELEVPGPPARVPAAQRAVK